MIVAEVDQDPQLTVIVNHGAPGPQKSEKIGRLAPRTKTSLPMCRFPREGGGGGNYKREIQKKTLSPRVVIACVDTSDIFIVKTTGIPSELVQIPPSLWA